MNPSVCASTYPPLISEAIHSVHRVKQNLVIGLDLLFLFHSLWSTGLFSEPGLAGLQLFHLRRKGSVQTDLEPVSQFKGINRGCYS